MLDPNVFLLWISGMLGVIFTNDYYVPWIFFTLLYYAVLWSTTPIHLAPVLDRYEFIVNNAFVFGYGVLAGLAVRIGYGCRELIPTHIYDGVRPTFGSALLTFSSIFTVRAVLIATGEYDSITVFDPGHASFAYWVAFGVFLALSIAVFILTWVQVDVDILRWFKLQRRRSDGYGPEADRMIPDLILALAALISTVLLWVFLQTTWSDLGAGLVTVGVQLFLWLPIYFYFREVRRIEETVFSPNNSVISWMAFCIVGAVATLVPGVTWLVMSVTSVSDQDARTVMSAMAIFHFLVGLILRFMVYRNRIESFDETLLGKRLSNKYHTGDMHESFQSLEQVMKNI